MQAIDAVVNEISLQEAAKQHSELRQALSLWGILEV